VRWVYLAIILLFLGVIGIFSFQNTQIVSLSFLAMAISAPLALVVFIAYVLGAVTGGSLYALLRKSVQGSRRAP
jgi:uncharacterized integral membrane protein